MRVADFDPSLFSSPQVGQILSSRPDLLPPPYLSALATLQDGTAPFSTALARAVVESELGASVDSVYSSFSPQPVASASLGQVYKATLRATGEEVAVKVQRPGVAASLAVDMALLRALAAALDARVPALAALADIVIAQPVAPLVDEFAAALFGELDYVQEGRAAETFASLYAGAPRVRVPGVVWSATRRRVLTLEWIDGVKLTDDAAMARLGLSVVDLVKVGVECTLRQLLTHGYFHADPHPGNLLATAAGDLVWLDFGMMATAPPRARSAIVAHVAHLVARDYAAMCRDYYDLGFVDASVDTSPIAPYLADFFGDVLNTPVDALNFKSIVDGLGGVLFKFPFRVSGGEGRRRGCARVSRPRAPTDAPRPPLPSPVSPSPGPALLRPHPALAHRAGGACSAGRPLVQGRARGERETAGWRGAAGGGRR